MAEREFPFFAFAHQGGKLVQGFVTAHCLYVVVFTEYGVCGGDGDLLAVLVAGDYSTGYGTGIDLHQATSENYGVRDTVDAGEQFGKLSAALCLQAAGFPVEVDVHDAGQQFHEQDNADYSERIGDTVGNGCQRRVGAVNGNGKSRRTGKRSGYESHHARRVDVEGIFQSRCRKGGGADNEQGDDDEGLPFAPEGVEEAGSRLYADGEDEQYESEVTQLLGDDDAEMPE